MIEAYSVVDVSKEEVGFAIDRDAEKGACQKFVRDTGESIALVNGRCCRSPLPYQQYRCGSRYISHGFGEDELVLRVIQRESIGLGIHQGNIEGQVHGCVELSVSTFLQGEGKCLGSRRNQHSAT